MLSLPVGAASAQAACLLLGDSAPVGAAVIQAAPDLLRVPPEHQPLAEQHDRVRHCCVQVLRTGHGVPGLCPHELGLLGLLGCRLGQKWLRYKAYPVQQRLLTCRLLRCSRGTECLMVSSAMPATAAGCTADACRDTVRSQLRQSLQGGPQVLCARTLLTGACAAGWWQHSCLRPVGASADSVLAPCLGLSWPASRLLAARTGMLVYPACAVVDRSPEESLTGQNSPN